MKRLLQVFALVYLSQTAWGLTTIYDTIYMADGSLASGTITLEFPYYCTGPDGRTISVTSKPFNVAAGIFSVRLEPNDTCNSTYYIATYALRNGPTSSTQREYWIVPTSTTPVSIDTIRQANTPSVPPYLIPITQLTPGTARGDLIMFNGTSWAYAAKCPDGATIIGDLANVSGLGWRCSPRILDLTLGSIDFSGHWAKPWNSGTGAASPAQCSAPQHVGRAWFRTDTQNGNDSLKVCANIGLGTFGWESPSAGTGGGGGSGTINTGTAQVAFGTAAGVLGGSASFLFDSTNSRLCVGCTGTLDTTNRLRVRGSGNVLSLIDTTSGNFSSALDIRSGAGGSTGDTALVRFGQGADIKWDVRGVVNGVPNFEIQDEDDSGAARLRIIGSTHALTLQPVAYNVDLIGNAAGTASATGKVNFSSSASTAPCKTGTSTPAACTLGQCFFKSDATAGANIYLCTAADVWTQMTGVGGGGGPGEVGGYTASFTAQDPLVILAGTHLLEACPADVKVWTVSGATLTRTESEDLVTCNSSTVTVTIDFPASTSGVVHLIPTGGTIDAGGTAFISGAPTSASMPCISGAVRYDAAYVYVCVATDQWKRSNLNSW